MGKQLLLAYYGDDFTGSTDALEFLCRAGLKTILFIEPPTEEQLNRFENVDAIGIAGKTRSMQVVEMPIELETAFQKLKQLKPRHIHYKVCSTFDSSPRIGSIGKAIEIAATVFENTLIPIIGGTPALGRYCVFGNLFARMGIGSNGQIYRLDQHPSMSKHPTTPAHESDLRLHLQAQTNQPIGLIDILQLETPIQEWNLLHKELLLLVDAMYDHQLMKIGEWLDGLSGEYNTQFSVGGSSVEMALGKYWNDQHRIDPSINFPILEKATSLLVVSGSCSPVTGNQIGFAIDNGFTEIIIDAVSIADHGFLDPSVIDQVLTAFQHNTHVIVHTGAKQPEHLSAEKLGTVLGLIAKSVVEKIGIQRVVIAGGDTSSYAARALEIEAVEMITTVIVGAPLCKAFSRNSNINGLELNFKGGQVGGPDYFGLF